MKTNLTKNFRKISRNLLNAALLLLLFQTAYAQTPTVIVSTTAACDHDGSATASVTGGTPPYTYYWYINDTMETTYSNVKTGLAGGTYWIYIYDNNGASDSGWVSFYVNPPFGLNASTTDENCSNADGTATILVTGGTSPYTYLWSTGANSQSVSGLSSGSYDVTVTDAAGCKLSFSETDSGRYNGGVFIDYNSPVQVSTIVSHCTNIIYNGSATATVAGGTVPYAYSWSTVPAQATVTATGLSPGYYSVFVYDANGCTSEGYAIIENMVPGVTVNYITSDSTKNTLCVGEPAIILTGGDANGYSYGDSVRLQIFTGDGKDTIIYSPIYSYSSTQGNYYGSLQYSYSLPGHYSVKIIALGSDGSSDTLAKYNIYVVRDSCGTITGTLYRDSNIDCANNAVDSPMPGWWIYLADAAGLYLEYAYTDANGNYSFNVPPGSYTIEAQKPWNSALAVTCPASGKYAVSSIPSSGNDFGVTCPAGFDLEGFLSGWGFRPGSLGYISMYVSNDRCLPVSGKGKIILDSKLKYIPCDSFVTGITVSGDTLIFDFAGISYMNPFFGRFCVITDSTANVGDTVCIRLILEPVSGDLVPANNDVTYCFPVRNSWDPNMKEVSPAENIVSAERLTYTVHFQNTGNDTAYNIFIMDTLDANLDPATFEVVSSSHKMEMARAGKGEVLRFIFNNIMLPDSGANEPKSHGFVTYKVSAKYGLVKDTEIRNTAHIYFDFNPAIVTNTTINKITITSLNEIEGSNSVSVFPNPAMDRITFDISGENSLPAEIVIFDVLGKVVIESPKIQDQKTEFNVQSLARGIYHYRITGSNGKVIGYGKISVL
jgi:uncharacterized repeat protein (TIGR01451 family)